VKELDLKLFSSQLGSGTGSRSKLRSDKIVSDPQHLCIHFLTVTEAAELEVSKLKKQIAETEVGH
jgi:hypothetical protein